jgi:hypothetical protein
MIYPTACRAITTHFCNARCIYRYNHQESKISGLQLQRKQQGKEYHMLLALYYVVAITILVLHFTGFLMRHNIDWLVLVLAVSVFPAVIFL